MTADEMFGLAAGLGEAKSRQHVADALRFMHQDMVLTSPAWGTQAKGKAQNSEALARFFERFPDYSISLDGHIADDTHLICWGTVRMTMAQGAYGLSPNGKRVEVPAFLRFTFKDGLIASEYFMVDLAAVCAQSGVSTDAVQGFLKAARAQRACRSHPPAGGTHMTDLPLVADPETEFLFEARVKLSPPLNVGPGPEGHRVIFFVKDGTVKGPRLNGVVIPDSGADWVRRRADGSSYLDVRFCWRTDDEAIIYVHWHGRFTRDEADAAYAHDMAKPDDPAGAHRYYFRAAPEFETGDNRYAWLNNIVSFTQSRTGDGGVIHRFYAVK